jgi:GWxTD domain-containing protein
LFNPTHKKQITFCICLICNYFRRGFVDAVSLVYKASSMKKMIILTGLMITALAVYGLEASFLSAVFHAEGSGYVETALQVRGASVSFVDDGSGRQQAVVEVVIYFERAGRIERFDKFLLHSPLMEVPGDFIDLRRYGLPEGMYTCVLELRDMNRADNSIRLSSSLDVRYAVQSDIQLLAQAFADTTGGPYVKQGIFMAPMCQPVYGRGFSALTFYHEVYQTDELLGDDFLVSYRIATATGTVLIAHKRRSPAAVVPLLLILDISELPTGEYQLVVDIRNRMQELISSRGIDFRRENPLLTLRGPKLDTMDLSDEFVAALSGAELLYSLRALTPRLAGKEQEYLNLLLNSDSTEVQRRYLFRYWLERNSGTPEQAYQQYMKVVRSVDATFISGFRRGFETDRGHIYLKYGAPDDIETREQEPSAPPYEIWSYYHFPATRQNNVKFIFYNPSLAPGDYVLLHSDAIGERQNPQWIRDLYKHAPAEWDRNSIDGNDIMDNFNRNAKRVLRDN